MIIYGDLASEQGLPEGLSTKPITSACPIRWARTSTSRRKAEPPRPCAAIRWDRCLPIELDDGRCLAQSNAIIRFLARGSAAAAGKTPSRRPNPTLLFWEHCTAPTSSRSVVSTPGFIMGRPKEAREPARVERGGSRPGFDGKVARRPRLARRPDDDDCRHRVACLHKAGTRGRFRPCAPTGRGSMDPRGEQALGLEPALAPIA